MNDNPTIGRAPSTPTSDDGLPNHEKRVLTALKKLVSENPVDALKGLSSFITNSTFSHPQVDLRASVCGEDCLLSLTCEGIQMVISFYESPLYGSVMMFPLRDSAQLFKADDLEQINVIFGPRIVKVIDLLLTSIG